MGRDSGNHATHRGPAIGRFARHDLCRKGLNAPEVLETLVTHSRGLGNHPQLLGAASADPGYHLRPATPVARPEVVPVVRGPWDLTTHGQPPIRWPTRSPESVSAARRINFRSCSSRPYVDLQPNWWHLARAVPPVNPQAPPGLTVGGRAERCPVFRESLHRADNSPTGHCQLMPRNWQCRHRGVDLRWDRGDQARISLTPRCL